MSEDTKELSAAQIRAKKKKIKQLGRNYADIKAQVAELNAEMNLIAPKIRLLAKEIGMDKTKEKQMLDDEHALEVRFSESVIYDQEEIQKHIKGMGAGSKKVFEKVFPIIPETRGFDSKALDSLLEAGAIKDDDELFEGEHPAITTKPGTPAIYITAIAAPTTKQRVVKKV